MIKYLLFDLDETLYPFSTGLMQRINERMNEFMVRQLGVPEGEVTALRQSYWHTYGTTLRGLYVERHIDPQPFLNYVHDIPLGEYLRADEHLDALLSTLPQDKYIFTNAPADHARRVLRVLGIDRHFRGIFDINFIEYASKPAESAYRKVLSALAARGEECLMIDDSARNLAPARTLGIRTVLLNGRGSVGSNGPEQGVDHTIAKIEELADILSNLTDHRPL
jgi:putative hydrolase of the HAD superfamily